MTKYKVPKSKGLGKLEDTMSLKELNRIFMFYKS